MGLVEGKDLVLKVETAVADTFITVNDMNKFNQNTQRNTSKVAVFARAAPYVQVGSRDRSYQISGLINLSDAGQLRLRLQESLNAVATIQVLWDGTNGFSEDVKVSSFALDATPDGYLNGGFNFDSDAAPAIVGTGPII